jgi:2-hydroxychromene-2-carboxylate isomerase
MSNTVKQPKTLEFYFDFGSPAAYLAWTQVHALAQETVASLVLKPMLLGGVFQATGNRSPMAVPTKGNYVFVDLSRFAKRYGVPLVMNPHFPINTLMLMRGAAGLQLRGDARLVDYCNAMFKAIWVDALAMGDAAVVGQVLANAGFDPQALLALTAEPDVKDHLKATTEEAVARGVFGAPTFFVGEQMFWGQDRLDFVRDSLRA